MLNRELIEKRLSDIRISVRRLSQLARLSEEQFVSDPDCFAIVEHHLRRSLEAILDIGRHIIAKQGLGELKDYLGLHGAEHRRLT